MSIGWRNTSVRRVRVAQHIWPSEVSNRSREGPRQQRGGPTDQTVVGSRQGEGGEVWVSAVVYKLKPNHFR